MLGTLAGCHAIDYRAADLPAQLQAPSVGRSQTLDLSRLAGPGLGTSRVAPGDLVELTINSGRGEDATEPIPARVSSNGQLSVPLVGPVAVAGLEPFEAEERIAAAAIERNLYRQPIVTLRVTEPAVNRVTVLGAVTNPGAHELPRGSSDLANALAAAGGFTEEAGTKIDVLRHDSPTFLAGNSGVPGAPSTSGVVPASYNFPAPPIYAADQRGADWSSPLPPRTTRIDLAQAQPSTSVNYDLNDRDVVMVLPDEKRFIHVTGLVEKPDQFELLNDQDVTVLDAIAMAGGVSSPVADKVFVIRRMSDMPEPAVIKVSISGAKRNGSENLRLAPGDLVSVETTVATTTVDTVSSLFRMTLGFGGNLVTF
jgi:polysaccharide export outer membrane protein